MDNEPKYHCTFYKECGEDCMHSEPHNYISAGMFKCGDHALCPLDGKAECEEIVDD